mgnify:CR=1 FL=1
MGQTNCVSFLTCIEEARIIRPSLEKLRSLRPPNQKAVVAVYKFSDLTGQRKSSSKMALFSTAVTQGAENYLIEALRGAGNGNWFTVVERSGLDHLTRERQLIKSTRQTYEGEGSNILKPLLYAGLIVEGTSNDFFRFIEEGTELVEIETGYSENEAIGYATRTAIETAVYQLVIDGLDKQLWDYNYEENT